MPLFSHYEYCRFENKSRIVRAFECVDENHDKAVCCDECNRCIYESSKGSMRCNGQIKLGDVLG